MSFSFILKALSFGVLGLCAVMLTAAWRVLVREQSRESEPRKGILRFTLAFMGFCVLLAILGAYVQLQQLHATKETPARLQETTERLQDVTFKLREIHRTLCDKFVYEVKQVKQQSPKTNTQTLEYMIARLQDEVDDAWQTAAGNAQLEPCRPFPP